MVAVVAAVLAAGELEGEGGRNGLTVFMIMKWRYISRVWFSGVAQVIALAR